MYGVLSAPLELTGSYDENIDKAYKLFQADLNNRIKRPTLFDKEVYIEAKEEVDEKPVAFWHLISLESSHRFNKVLPCCNDVTIEICNENCNKDEITIDIKYGTERRNVCLYRASRLPWIKDIIKLANKGDSSVNVWRKPGVGKQSDKVYLRYNHEGADYIIMFSAEKYFYRLISAFPVFYLKEKRRFDKDFSEYKWSYFNE